MPFCCHTHIHKFTFMGKLTGALAGRQAAPTALLFCKHQLPCVRFNDPVMTCLSCTSRNASHSCCITQPLYYAAVGSEVLPYTASTLHSNSFYATQLLHHIASQGYCITQLVCHAAAIILHHIAPVIAHVATPQKAVSSDIPLPNPPSLPPYRAISSQRLVPGDVIVVLPGSATCDMVLLQGNCLVEESNLSGEVISLLLPSSVQTSVHMCVHTPVKTCVGGSIDRSSAPVCSCLPVQAWLCHSQLCPAYTHVSLAAHWRLH